MLRVLIADDHEIVRRGIRDIIESHPGWEVCGEAADGQAALDLAVAQHPDVAVLDISLPVLNGIIVTRRLRQESPRTNVLLFTMHDDDETVSGGLAAGARGYLLKSDSEDHLEAAISASARTARIFPPSYRSCCSKPRSASASDRASRASPCAKSRSRS